MPSQSAKEDPGQPHTVFSVEDVVATARKLDDEYFNNILMPHAQRLNLTLSGGSKKGHDWYPDLVATLSKMFPLAKSGPAAAFCKETKKHN